MCECKFQKVFVVVVEWEWSSRQRRFTWRLVVKNEGCRSKLGPARDINYRGTGVPGAGPEIGSVECGTPTYPRGPKNQQKTTLHFKTQLPPTKRAHTENPQTNAVLNSQEVDGGANSNKKNKTCPTLCLALSTTCAHAFEFLSVYVCASVHVYMCTCIM